MDQKKLGAYKNKRDFSKTGEPRGQVVGSTRRLKFVVQWHHARRQHYDFRLEWDGVLLSWAVPKGPSLNPRERRLAVKVEDHPYQYRLFEGMIPKGQYGAGPVLIWDRGYYQPLEDFHSGLASGRLRFRLFGSRLKGEWRLVQTKGEKGENNWLLIKVADKYARLQSVTKLFTTSVKSGRTIDQISDLD